MEWGELQSGEVPRGLVSIVEYEQTRTQVQGRRQRETIGRGPLCHLGDESGFTPHVVSLHHRITVSLYHCTTVSLYHCITISPHYNTTEPATNTLQQHVVHVPVEQNKLRRTTHPPLTNCFADSLSMTRGAASCPQTQSPPQQSRPHWAQCQQTTSLSSHQNPIRPPLPKSLLLDAWTFGCLFPTSDYFRYLRHCTPL